MMGDAEILLHSAAQPTACHLTYNRDRAKLTHLARDSRKSPKPATPSQSTLLYRTNTLGIGTSAAHPSFYRRCATFQTEADDEFREC